MKTLLSFVIYMCLEALEGRGTPSTDTNGQRKQPLVKVINDVVMPGSESTSPCIFFWKSNHDECSSGCISSLFKFNPEPENTLIASKMAFPYEYIFKYVRIITAVADTFAVKKA